MVLATLVAIGFLFIVGIVAFALFGSAFDDFFAKIDEAKKQAEEQDPATSKDVGGDPEPKDRLCNLRIEFVGSAQGKLITDDITLHHGSFQDLIRGHDERVIEYKWFCPEEGPKQASLLDFMGFHAEDKLSKLSLTMANLYEQQIDVPIRFFLEGNSMTHGAKLTALENPDHTERKLVFSASQTLQAGTEFPFQYSVVMFLYDVVEDDYDVQFWNEDFRVNDRPLGFKFDHEICKAGNYNEDTKTCGV